MKLRADFDAGTFASLTDATLYGEDLGAASVSESVAGTISKSLSGADAYDVLSRLLRNGTNVLVYPYLDVTSYAVLLNLPTDIVKILPWSSPVAVTGIAEGPTGGMPTDFWNKISASASALANALVCASQPTCLDRLSLVRDHGSIAPQRRLHIRSGLRDPRIDVPSLRSGIEAKEPDSARVGA